MINIGFRCEKISTILTIARIINPLFMVIFHRKSGRARRVLEYGVAQH